MDNRFHRKNWRRKSSCEDFLSSRQFLSSPAVLMLLFAFLSSFMILSVAAAQPAFPSFDFVVEPTSQEAVASRPATLDCVVSYSGVARPKIYWLKGGSVKLDNTRRRYQLPNGSLVFDPVQDSRQGVSDKGDYRCAATVKGLGTILSRKARLDIAHLPRKFDKEPRSLSLAEGETAAFECLIKSQPTPTITWYKGTSRLYNSGTVTMYPTGTLEIGPLTHKDFGPYHCQASIPGRTRNSQNAMLMMIPHKDSSKDTPTFIVRPRSQRVVKGQTVYLHCVASGKDRDGRPAVVSWLKDGRTIDFSDKLPTVRRMGAGTLVLTQVGQRDSGVYTCRAVNQEDSVDAEATLDVLVPPEFKQKPQNQVAFAQSDATLTCSVIGDPKPAVTWLKNGDPLKASDYFKVERDGSLLIRGLIEPDAGVYQCLAHNELADIQASAQLVVQTEVRARTSDAKLLPATPTNLKVVLASMRFITLAWHMKPSSTVSSSSASSTKADPTIFYVFWREDGIEREQVRNTTLQEYNIQGLKPDTSYEIRVRARNRHGSSLNEAKIGVKTTEEAIVSSPPRDVKVIPLSSTSIKVSWSPPLDPKGTVQNYRLLYYQVGSEAHEDNVTVTGTSYILKNLLSFRKYSFSVVAVTENGFGQSTNELKTQTFSNRPSAPPQNFSLEVASSTSLIVRWQPPLKNFHNGLITGYRIRFKRKGGQGQTYTTDGKRKTYALTELAKGSEYQVRISASTVNGTGPFTHWAQGKTFEDDLDESTVPPKPASLYVRAKDNSIIVTWAPPPPHSQILVRGYVLGYGRRIADVYSIPFTADVHEYTIENLQHNSEYIITIRAKNKLGPGEPRFATLITPDRTVEEPAAPMLPPVGVNAHVLSATTIMLTWADNSLSKSQKIIDNRFYTISYRPQNSRNKHFRSINATDLNCHIEGLRPNTKYAFKVKVIKGQRHSDFSMMVTNKTEEAAPSTEPRDVTPVRLESDPLAVSLNWQPPARPNGQITGYLVYYTNDLHINDDDLWPVEGVVGDKLSTVISKLTPDTTYNFRVRARNSKGFSPKSEIKTFVTPKVPDHSEPEASKGKGLSTNTIIIISACVAAFIFCTIVIICIVILCRRRDSHSTNTNKNAAMKSGKMLHPGVKPPDLWIHQPSHLDINKMDRSQRSESSVSVATSTLRRGSRGSAEHTDDQGSTLDRRRNSFVGDCGGYPSSGEERYQPIQPRNIIRPKPIALPPDASGLVGGHNGHIMGYPGESPISIPMRPIYPRTQYNTQYSTAARVNAGDIPHTCTPSMALSAVSEDERSHLVPHTHSRETIGTGMSSMEDSYNSRIGYVKPQPNLSPYKKPTPPLTAPAKGQRPPIQFNSTKSSELMPKNEDSDMSAHLQKSLSTEELTAEMANLEGLMKDLNAITQQEFEC